ncbi:MAG: hypothetical protein WCP55_10695 [Lentisphaerota bacterium]
MKKFFNMIEITLAIAVVGLGMVSIMALFPVGFQASRDAIGDNYSSYSANEIISYLAKAAQRDWTVIIGTDDTTGYIKTEVDSRIADTNIDAPANWTTHVGSIYTAGGALIDGQKFFGMSQGSTAVVDFSAHARIWKSMITGIWIFNQNAPSITYDKAVKLNIEMSWPVEKPYSQREKRYYSIELFKEN